MKELTKLLEENEDWLIKRILRYAKDRNYTQYTSTLEEAWRMSIVGLSASITSGIRRFGGVPELDPDENLATDPLTAFGVTEAKKHRERGIPINMFLGLMKYYNQTYHDLVAEKAGENSLNTQWHTFIQRCFDRIEIAFCHEWSNIEEDKRLKELQDANRRIINEKNNFLTVFESFSDPVILLSPDKEIVNLNHAAALLIDPNSIPGSQYYSSRESGSSPGLTRKAFHGKQAAELFPWLSKEIICTDSGKCREKVQEMVIPVNGEERVFELQCSPMLDVSEKFSGTILMLRDVTQRKEVSARLEESEEKYRTLFDLANDAIYLSDTKTHRFVDFNDMAADRLGYTREELLNLTIEDIHPPMMAAKSEMIFKEIAVKGYVVFEHIMVRKNGQEFPVEISSRIIKLGGEQRFLSYVRDLTQRIETQTRLEHEFAINAALSGLYKPLISSSSTIEDITQLVLEKSQALTGSEHGYASSIDPVSLDNVIHTFTRMLDNCDIEGEDRRIVFPIGPDGKYNGLWGHCLNTKNAFFTNSPEQHSSSKGLPNGHVPIKRFLSVPILLGDELVGQIALANKNDDYNDLDLEKIQRMAEYYALAIQRMMVEDELQHAHDELEKRVHERTEELRESEERSRAIADYTYDWENWVAPEGKLIWANPAVERITGYSLDEYIENPQRLEKLIVEEDRERIVAELNRGLKEKLSANDIPFRIRRKDGPTRWVSVSYQPIYDRQGKHLGMRSSIRDFTERREEESKRQESEAQYKRLVEGIPGILYLYSEKRGGIFYSPRVEEVLGYTTSQLRKHPHLLRRSIHKDDREKVVDALNSFAEGEDFQLEYRIIDAKGEWHWFLDHSIGRRESEDEIIVEGLALDITAQRTAEQEREKLRGQLRELQKMEAIGTLAGGIAHDFNNILAAIIGYTELAIMNAAVDQQLKINLEQVLKAGNRAKDLVNQILTFSRQGSGEKKPVKVHIVAMEVLKLLQATIPKSIRIKKKIATDSSPILADPTQIHQVLMNLCTNAYHAMKDQGGTLEVQLETVKLTSNDFIDNLRTESGDHIKITVSDTGHGMSRIVRERIFDPYFTTKKQGEGTGLGLAVVHGIITSHDGHINVYSEPGRGTVFHIYLPCIESGVDQANTAEISLPQGGTEHILLVDDEEPLVIMQQEMLEKLGYHVSSVYSSSEALRLFKKNPDIFDLVISDMSMPRMSGTQLAKQLFQINPEIPIILCTGFSDTISEGKAKSLGFHDFLLKPVILTDLARSIRTALDKKN